MATIPAIRHFGNFPEPTKPTAIRPPENLILAAMLDLPYLVLKWAPRGNFEEPVHIWEFMLVKGGFNSEDPAHAHSTAAAQWAIHRFVTNGMLLEKPAPAHMQNQASLVPDESLWEWWRRQKHESPEAAHSEDFRSAVWFGATHSFTENQATVVERLWIAWANNTPDVGDETLLQAVDHEAPPRSLRDLFRGNPAWGTMIVQGSTKGSHSLNVVK